jgi:UDP-4-amino-4,6-dideoxy-N-acetyl-beta-L-altrosamine N-acetyltransferase
MENIRLIKLAQGHLPLVRQWRNSPDVRENMYTNHQINDEEHRGWFESVKKDPRKEYFVFELDGQLCGVIGFVDIDVLSRTASWSFYSGDPTRRGIGSLMEVAALDYAFDVLKIQKLSCEVLEFNEPVIKFHKKHGFKIEGLFVKQYFRDGRYFDIYRMAIFDSDWTECREEVRSQKKNSVAPGTSYSHSFTITSKQVDSFVLLTGGEGGALLNEASTENPVIAESIVQGLLAGLILPHVFDALFSGEVATYLDQSFSFISPVCANKSLQADVIVASKVGGRILVETTIANMDSGLPLVKGEATFFIPTQTKRSKVNSI